MEKKNEKNDFSGLKKCFYFTFAFLVLSYAYVLPQFFGSEISGDQVTSVAVLVYFMYLFVTILPFIVNLIAGFVCLKRITDDSKKSIRIMLFVNIGIYLLLFLRVLLLLS